MDLTLSNHFDLLFEAFLKAYQQASPFEKHWVFVPSFSTEYTIKKKLALELGISMGVDFSFLMLGIKRLVSIFFPECEEQAQLELALDIEAEIKEILDTYPHLPLREKKCLAPLVQYFDSMNAKSQSIPIFSDQLASLFSHYALYAPSIEEDWEKKENFHWQQILWKKVCMKKSFLTHPRKVLQRDPISYKERLNIYLFGFNFIPLPYLEILLKLKDQINLHILHLSPSKLFWTDIRSPYEKATLISHLRREKAPKSQLDSLSQYLSETNPLLASWGRLGRNGLQLLEELSFYQINENYTVFKEALELPCYQDYHSDMDQNISKSPMSLLRHIQMDILTLRKPNETIHLSQDTSLQVHQATTYQREVEVLYDYLIDLFDKDDSLNQHDVMVLVPEMERYLPYLENIFQSSESPFLSTFHDSPFSLRNSLLRGFHFLIELVHSRWDKEALFELFNHPLFKKSLNLKSEQVKEWRDWLEEINFQWGLDPNHQTHTLEREYGDDHKIKKSPGSWKDFFNHLIDHLSIAGADHAFGFHINRFDFSDISSLNTLAETLGGLQRDLEPLEKNELAPFEQWAKYLAYLLQTYFGEEYRQSIEFKSLLRRIHEVGKLSEEKKEKAYSFRTFWFYLKKDLSVFHTEVYGQQIEALSFYSLFSKPMRPAKVICILGLSEGIYPRNPLENPLSELKNFSEELYTPTTVDQDRYQFLELILLAKESLYLSFLGISPLNYREQLPSLLISEVLNYVDKYYLIKGNQPSLMIKKTHPHLRFDMSYFKEDNTNQDAFQMAKNYYLADKKKAQSTLSRYFNQVESFKLDIDSFKKQGTISLQALMSFLRDPMQRALNHQFQVYVRDDKWGNPHQNYALTPLQRAILRKRTFNKAHFKEEDPSIPQGLFKEVLEHQAKEEQEVIEQNLHHLSLKKDSLLFIEFREDIKKAQQFSPTHWLVPALRIEMSPNCRVKVVGVLENVSEKGLLVLGKSSFENVWCNWPSLLALTQLSTTLNQKFETQIHFLSSSKSSRYEIKNPLDEFKNLISYYILGSEFCLPYMPSWISTFVYQPLIQLKKKMVMDLQSEYFDYPYVKSLMNPSLLPEDQKLNHWQQLSKELFSNTLNSINSVLK